MNVLELVHKLVVSPPPPYSFEYTVLKEGTDRWWKTPRETCAADVLWSALVYHDRVVGVKLCSRGSVEEPLIEVEVFSQEDVRADFESQIRSALGGDEDITAFYELSRKYPYLKVAAADLYGLKACRGDAYDLFYGILRCMLYQRAHYKRGRAMRDALLHHFGEHIQFDGKEIIFWPLPVTLAEAGEETLKKVCNLGFRASYIFSLAEAFARGKVPDIEELRQMEREDAMKELKQLRGVGPQTAQLCAPHPSFPVAQWNVQFLSRLFFRDESHSKAQIQAFARAEFGKWQDYAFEYIMRDRAALEREELL